MQFPAINMLNHVIWRGSRWLHHWLEAVDVHSLQAPFIYNFYEEVIKPRHRFPVFEKIEKERKSLLRENRTIITNSPGAPSKINSSNKRPVKAIARHSMTSEKYSQLLFRLAKWKQPYITLELGTSLGINTLYLHEGNPRGYTSTMEGCSETAKWARDLLVRWDSSKINVIEGNIDLELPSFVAKNHPVDLIFMDANHRYQPTMAYFEKCWSHLADGGIIIIDDIHWSPEMERAWYQIKNLSTVYLTIDLFQMGIVINQKGLQKQHYAFIL